MEINIHNDTLEVKATKTVKLSQHLTLLSTEGAHDLMIDITADLSTVPEQYHEVFMNMLTSKYLNKVSFGHNPFSNCQPPLKKKWWQLWKQK